MSDDLSMKFDEALLEGARIAKEQGRKDVYCVLQTIGVAFKHSICVHSYKDFFQLLEYLSTNKLPKECPICTAAKKAKDSDSETETEDEKENKNA